jgi:uncharacterized protein YndB with AHSA1/START domain
MFIDVPPERVFEVLSDAACYPHWVVGAKAFRGSDPDFPAIGTRFHHAVGVGPVTINDHTEVVDANPPYRLELIAHARPLGNAKVTMLLEPRADGTYVTMLEDGADLLSKLIFNPVTHVATHARNVESLRRLKAIAERGVGAADALARSRPGSSPPKKKA